MVTRRASFAAGAVAALVLGSGTAVAATGGKFILGQANSASRTTGLTNKSGTALALTSKAGTAPLKVSGTTKVANLNADQVDGKSSTAFASVNGRTGTIDTAGQAVDQDSNGFPDFIVANAPCPAGTQRTGGGGADFTKTGVMIVNGPDSDGSWTVVVATDNATAENGSDVTASAVCYNPRGAVAGSSTRVAQTSSWDRVSPAMKAKIEAAAAKR